VILESSGQLFDAWIDSSKVIAALREILPEGLSTDDVQNVHINGQSVLFTMFKRTPSGARLIDASGDIACYHVRLAINWHE
jgi:hypothetical protein